MEIEFIKELALTMKEIDINELEYSEKNGERIKLKRNNRFKSDFEGQKNIREYNDLDNCQSSYEKKDYTDNTIKNIDNQNDIELERNEKNKQEASEKLEEEKNTSIKSNMIGTFYSSSSPGEESFVKENSKVKKGDVICIIESMKLMNEIKAPFDCEITKCLIQDEEIVEFGQDLFEVRGFDD